MFYKMIETKRNEWLASETCTVKVVIDYIVKTGQMRDAQVEAIKTYLDEYQGQAINNLWTDISTLKGANNEIVKLDLFPHRYKDGIIRVCYDFLTNKRKQASLLPDVFNVSNHYNGLIKFSAGTLQKP